MAQQKVFVSYSSKNARFVKREILPALKRTGRESWFAPKDIGVGDDWRHQLLEGLDTCDRLLVVVSKEAQQSSYVRDELANATKKLLAKAAKLDARQVHRAILPVKLDPRGPHGAPVKRQKDDAEVDPYLVHPYLTLVNFVTIPYSEELNLHIDPKKDKYTGDRKALSPEQWRSVSEYIQERRTARKRLDAAIRNPEHLRYGFKLLGRLVMAMGHASVQRVVLAAAIVLCLWALPLQWIVHKTIGMPTSDGIAHLDISAEDFASMESAIANGPVIEVGPEPMALAVRAATTGGHEHTTHVTLRAKETIDYDPLTIDIVDEDGRAWGSEGPVIRIPIHDAPLRFDVLARGASEGDIAQRLLLDPVRGETPPPDVTLQLDDGAPARFDRSRSTLQLTDEAVDLTVFARDHADATSERVVTIVPPKREGSAAGPDVLWFFPPHTTVRVGEPLVLRAGVVDAADESPLSGYTIAYEPVRDRPRIFDGGQTSFKGTTDDDGIVLTTVSLDRGRPRAVVLKVTGSPPPDSSGRVGPSASTLLRIDFEAPPPTPGSPRLRLDVLDEIDPVDVGSTAIYEIKVSNVGNAPDTRVVVQCELPKIQTFEQGIGPNDTRAKLADGVIRFPVLARLEPGQSVTYTVIVNARGSGEARFAARVTSASQKEPLDKTEVTQQRSTF